MRSLQERELVTAREAARLIRTGHVSVLRWVESGLIEGYRTPGGHVRIRKTALVGFLRKQQMPVPKELVERVKLLVIDDEPHYLRALKQLLQQQDARLDVELASSGHEGLLRIGTDRPRVVLLDAHMPRLDGIETCQLLKDNAATADIPVIGMSGRGGDFGDRMRAAGAAVFLPKPISARDVLSALEAVGVLPMLATEE
ncbi:MAG: response regulator [Deltaproteobacteria bacterium]|nr:response regulator [Deltaproteobacteria bacterium]